jgi:hypothetical protein
MVPKSPSWRLSNVKSDNEQVLIQKSGSENSASVPDDISFFVSSKTFVVKSNGSKSKK